MVVPKLLKDFVKYETKEFKVTIPENCKYVYTNKVYVPLFTVFKEKSNSLTNYKNKNLVQHTNRTKAEFLIQKYRISESEILDNIVNKPPETKPIRKEVLNTSTTPPTPILLIIVNLSLIEYCRANIFTGFFNRLLILLKTSI